MPHQSEPAPYLHGLTNMKQLTRFDRYLIAVTVLTDLALPALIVATT